MGYYDYPEFDGNPVIHALRPDNVMLTILRLLNTRGKTSEADFVRHIEERLNSVPRFGSLPPDEVPRRTQLACDHLAAARLISAAEEGNWSITERGRAVLAEHSLGVDDSVLMTFAEYRAYLHARNAAAPPEDVRARAFEDGMAAYIRGKPITANPFEPDTSDHLSWECGWCESRDEEAR